MGRWGISFSTCTFLFWPTEPSAKSVVTHSCNFHGKDKDPQKPGSLPAHYVCLPRHLSLLLCTHLGQIRCTPRSFWQSSKSPVISVIHTNFGQQRMSSESKYYKTPQKISLIEISVSHVSQFFDSLELYATPQHPWNLENALSIAAASNLNAVSLFPSKTIVCRTWSVFRPHC